MCGNDNKAELKPGSTLKLHLCTRSILRPVHWTKTLTPVHLTSTLRLFALDMTPALDQDYETFKSLCSFE